MARPSPDPESAAKAELRRALLGACLFPATLAGYAFTRRGNVRASEAALQATPAPPREPQPQLTGLDRPPKLFLSCGEASSEVHAARVAGELRRWLADAGAPEPTLLGLGGDTLREAGVETVSDPTAKAEMGAQGVLGQLGFWRQVLTDAGAAMKDCDAVLAVDAPAFHLPLARIAQKMGVPFVHFVSPQYWAWGPWRAKAYAQAVTRSLAILPFEPSWFEAAGVPVEYVGHPQVDLLEELPEPPPPSDESRRAVILLPGSRRKEVEGVLPAMLAALEHAAIGDAPVLILQRDDRHAEFIRSAIADRPNVELRLGDPHGPLREARAALATSGTVLLDLLHHRVPAAVLYSLTGRVRSRIAGWLVTVPWFASPNLLAGKEVLPELAFPAESPPEPRILGEHLSRCYNDAAWRASCLEGLSRARERLGAGGACRRAAGHLLEVMR